MAVRAIIGFDHLPQSDTSWINYATHGITRGADLSAQTTIESGWLVSKATSSGAERITIPLDKYLAAPVAKIWVGVRHRATLNAKGGAGLVYFGNSYVLLDTSVGNTGTTSYIEFSYTIATGVIERWVNGVKIADSAATAGLRSLNFGLEAKGSLNGRYDYRDIYICDDQGLAQGFPIGPLGPQIAIPVTCDSAVGADWVTTPGGTTLVDAISEPGAIPTNKIATSDVNTKGPLTASLKATVPAGVTISAIEMVVGSSSAGASTVNSSTKLKSGSNELAGGLVQGPVGTYNYNGSVGVFHRNPAGTAWDSASLDATDFILTPDA